MLRVEGITLSAGGADLLIDASLVVHRRDRVGLVGRNGTGKTTLLRAIVGEVAPDAGRIEVRKGTVVGWLPQDAVSGSKQALWDEARSRMTTLDALQERFDAAERAVEAGEPMAAERLDDATEALRMAGGFALDERIGTVLSGLGFRKEDWARPCDTFSGGWQMRIALARVMLADPDLVLLDEPTNHLDLLARSFLAGFLERYRGAVLVVSHDRHLLDRSCNRIAEIRSRRLDVYSGNFTSWLAQRELRAEQHEAAFQAQKQEIARLERFVTRFGAKATKASQAQSRQRVLDRMQRIEAPLRESRPRFRLPPAPGGGSVILTLRKAGLGWPGGSAVLSDVEFELERGMRVAVIGPNGAGKSTLLHALAGRLPLLSGVRKVGRDARIGLFTQDLAQTLPGGATAVETVLARAPRALPEQARAALGALGLSGEAAQKPVDELSGGEKARVALAAFSVQPHDGLLLDEPTNHLDAVTVEVLANALRGFDGAMVLVTHDRYLVEHVATHVAKVLNGVMELREGVRAEDFEPATLARESAAADAERASGFADRKRRQRERERNERRLGVVLAEIHALELRATDLEARMIAGATDHLLVHRLDAERRAVLDSSEVLYREWEALERELSEQA